MSIELKLHRKQYIFHERQDYDAEGHPLFTMTLFGGSAGPGKSFATGASAILSAVEEPGSQIFIMRLHLADLKRTTLQVFEQFVCPEGSPLWKQVGMKFNRSDLIMTLEATADPKNGIPPSEIHWIGLRASSGSLNDAYNKLLSSQWSRGYIDEAFEIPEEVMTVLPSRIRLQRNGREYRRGLKLASNPAPNWLKKWFITDPKPHTHFIPCNWEENAANLPHDYGDSFDLMTQGMQQRFKHGNWDAYEGQVWHPLDPRQILPRLNLRQLARNDEWERIRACDPGLSDPTALATSVLHHPTDTLIFVSEYQENQLEITTHARNFRLQYSSLFGDLSLPSTDLIDPAASQKTLASGPTTNVLTLFRAEGFHFRPANNSTEVKTLTMAERMCYNPHRINPLTGQPGGFGVYFVGPDTERMRDAILNTTWDSPTPTGQQRWVNRNKHLVDCATYTTAYVGSRARGRTARGEVNALDALVESHSHNPLLPAHEPKSRLRSKGASPAQPHGLDAYFDV